MIAVFVSGSPDDFEAYSDAHAVLDGYTLFRMPGAMEAWEQSRKSEAMGIPALAIDAEGYSKTKQSKLINIR